MESKPQTPDSEEVPWEQQHQLHLAAQENCWEACQQGDLANVKEFFGQLDHDDRYVDLILLGRTIKGDLLNATRCLLEQGADPKRLGLGLIVGYCRSLAMLELFAEFGVEYKYGDKRGAQNVLLYVIDRREILDWLVDQGIDINLGSHLGMAPRGNGEWCRDNTVAVLNEAAKLGDIDLFDHLVALGAEPSQSNAIHHATGSSNAASIIPHLIEKYHFDVNASDDCGGLNDMPPWHITQVYPLGYAVAYSNIPAVKVLLRYGARVDKTYLKAISNEDASILKLLLGAVANPSEALGWAIIKDFFEGVKLCLEHGGEVAEGELLSKKREASSSSYHGMSDRTRKLLDDWRLLKDIG